MANRVVVLFCLFLPALASADDGLALETFFKLPEYESMVISPGGDFLAVTVPQGNSTGVVILDISDFPQVKPSAQLSPAEREHATNLFWATRDRLLFTTNRQGGSLAIPMPTGQVFAVNADGSNRRRIFGPERRSRVFRSIGFLHRLPDNPRQVLVLERAHDNPRPFASRLNILRENHLSTAAGSPLSTGILGVDQRGRVLFAQGMTDDLESQFSWRPDEDSAWRSFKNPFEGDIRFWGFDESGDHFFVASRDQNAMGVFQFNVKSGEYSKLLSDDRHEPLAPVWGLDGTTLIGAVFDSGRPEVKFIDENHPTSRMVRSLVNALPHYSVQLTSYTDDHRYAVVRLSSDQEPGVFMLLDVENMGLNELVAQREWVPVERMARMQPIQFQARDGLELEGFLTVPPGAEAKDLPLVVEVHGGPHGIRDSWSWQPWVQAMASRGYAVLQVNFRGSGGRGSQFESAGHGQWGGAMQDDVTDAVRWVVEQGIANPDRICISGASFGGYSAMMSAIREPDLYRCAFAFIGIYDLEELKKVGNVAQRVSWGPAFLERVLGSDPARLHEHSPSRHADRIQAEVFIAHGAEDRQAHFDQYHIMTAALEKAGVRHQKLFVAGEGHGFFDLDNNVKLYSTALDLFDRTIGTGWRPEARASD
ncbi:MAG: alpha/beta hydrolase family protein [Wenzhouxiangella sp.]